MQVIKRQYTVNDHALPMHKTSKLTPTTQLILVQILRRKRSKYKRNDVVIHETEMN